MRLTVLAQYARGAAHHDDTEGQHLLKRLERIKWLLWRGNHHRALQEAKDLFGSCASARSREGLSHVLYDRYAGDRHVSDEHDGEPH